jgi:hypothetical protein
MAYLHGANDFQQREQYVFVGPPFCLGRENVEPTPTVLNWFIQSDTEVPSPPQPEQLLAQPEELFIEAI